jgi:hypothetical protein
VGISNRQLALITLVILATAPAEAARRLARWASTTRQSVRSRYTT